MVYGQCIVDQDMGHLQGLRRGVCTECMKCIVYTSNNKKRRKRRGYMCGVGAEVRGRWEAILGAEEGEGLGAEEVVDLSRTWGVMGHAWDMLW